MAASPATHRSPATRASSAAPRSSTAGASPTARGSPCRGLLVASQEPGHRSLGSAAGDAVAQLRGVREDVKQLLKATSGHPILVFGMMTKPLIRFLLPGSNT